MNFRKKFRTYSLYNTILIYIQYPAATRLRGARQWEKDFGRRIKTGEKGIYIYVPVSVKQKEEDPAKTSQPEDVNDLKITRFILRPIFDISQTEEIEGKAVAIPEEPKWFSDEAIDEKSQVIYDALLEFAKVKNINVSVGKVGMEGARGSSAGGEIALLTQNISTMVHELAHELLHWKDDRSSFSKQVKELQAEGVANVVLQEYGLPSEHTEKYLALWKVDADNITKNETIIRKVATEIIDFINDYAIKEPSEPTPDEGALPESLNKFDSIFKKYTT